jgi:hypothetical protein
VEQEGSDERFDDRDYPELEQRLAQEASKEGEAVPDQARRILEERFGAVDRKAQRERNQAAIALLDEWFAAGDAEGETWDPVEVTPLSLREVQID